MAENQLDLVYEVTADASKAVAQTAQFGKTVESSMRQVTTATGAAAATVQKSLAANLKEQGVSATHAAQIYTQLGFTQKAAAADIAAAFGVAATATDAAGAAARRTGNELRQAQVSAILLQREFDLHLPRGINTMLARTQLVGPLLQHAFSVMILVYFAQNLQKIVEGIEKAALAAGGFGEAAQEAFGEAVKASDKAIVSYGNLKEGVDLRAEVNRNIAALTRQRDALNESGGIAMNWARAVFAFLSGQTAAAVTYTAKVWAQRDATAALTKEEGKRFQQLDTERELQKQRHAELDKQAKERERLAREEREFQFRGHLEMLKSAQEFSDRQIAIGTAHARELLTAITSFQKQVADETAWRLREQVEFHRDSSKAQADIIAEMERRATVAISNLTSRSARLRQEWIASHTQLRLLSQTAYGQFIPAFQAAAATLENFRNVGMQTFADFQRGMASNIAQAFVYKESIGAALAAVLKQALANIATEAVVQALRATALGFYLLAIQDYRGAAMAFKSAAVWGAVGAAAAVAGRAIPMPGAEKPTGVGLPTAPTPTPAAAGAGVAAEEPQRIVQIYFQGPVYGGEAGINELIRDISAAVQNRDANLVARRSKLPPYATH